MPDYRENTTENINADEKIYPWETEDMDFSLYKKLDGYGMQLVDAAKIIDRGEELEDLHVNMTTDFSDVNDAVPADESRKIVGGESGRLVLFNETAGNYYTPVQVQEATDIYEKVRKLQEDVSAHLRSRYKGKDDAVSRDYQAKADQYADMLDLDSEVADPKKGVNLFQAYFNAPYIASLRASAGAIPKFGTEGFEKCIDIMDPKSSNGISIYDDYMTMMSASGREQKVQLHRQQMEKDGWDAGKEKTYLNELRMEHQKSIEAFDKLWEVDDKGQYDSALNNKLNELVARRPGDDRDANNAIGYMRGEVRGIDLGYDSKHLYILGQVGMQEQSLKKRESVLDFQRKEAERNIEDYRKDPAEFNSRKDQEDATLESLQTKLQDITDRQQKLKEYKEDFTEFKNGLWNQKVNTPEEMKSAGRQVDEFFSSHQEKYADLQGCQNTYKQGIDYNKKMAANSPVTAKSGPMLLSSDVQNLVSVIAIQNMMEGAEFAPNGMVKMANLMDRSSHPKNLLEHKIEKGKAAADIPLTESFSKECSDAAKEFSDGIDAYRESHKLPGHPRTQALRDGLLEFAKLGTDSMLEGRHIIAQNSPDNTAAFGRISTLIPQLGTKSFDAGNLDKTEKVLKEYPLDKYIQQGLELHKMEASYNNKKDSMTQKEKDAYQETIRAKKEDYVDLAKELRAKSKNPSEDTLSLFGRKDLLTKEDTGFIGGRGLKGLIDRYEKEFAQTDITKDQTDRFKSSLNKLSAKRAGLFDSEGDDRRSLREQAQKMQENLKTLQNGQIDTPSGPRTLTQKEKTDLLADTIDGLNDLSSKADIYINHATKNGSKTPVGAGMTRLEGARELKDLTNELQDTLMKEQQNQMKYERNRLERQAAKGVKPNVSGDAVRDNTGINKENGRKSISFKELQEKDSKQNGGRKRSNSVREPAKRPKPESVKHGQNDAMQNNKAVAPRKK